MEVSKVKLRPETFQLAQRPMSRKRKTKLRRELILEYLNDRPYGKRVKMAELQRVGQFTTPQAADVFIKKMVRDGVIVRHELGLRAYFYTVPGKLVSRKILSAPPPAGIRRSGITAFPNWSSWPKISPGRTPTTTTACAGSSGS